MQLLDSSGVSWLKEDILFVIVRLIIDSRESGPLNVPFSPYFLDNHLPSNPSQEFETDGSQEVCDRASCIIPRVRGEIKTKLRRRQRSPNTSSEENMATKF